jgi:uncharacterized protein (UPF0335 family)
MTGDVRAAACPEGMIVRILGLKPAGAGPARARVTHQESGMSAVEKEQPEAANTRFAKDQLKAFVERIERLEEEKRTIADDIKDVYAEAKGNGFDVKIMRKVVSLRRQDMNKRREEEAILDIYLSALGMHATA